MLSLFQIVSQQTAKVVERFGKYHRTLTPGLYFLVPFYEKVSYKHSLKEEAIGIDQQTAITKDNVTVKIDGTLFIKIEDPYKASYKIDNPIQGVTLLALTVLRSEVGKMKLDKLFQERKALNEAIHKAVHNTSQEWGLSCLRYEILNIEPPKEIKISMQYEAEAERLKRKDILSSEGKQQSEINIAQGYQISQIKIAEGDSESLKIISQAEAKGIKIIGEQLEKKKDIKEKVIKYLLTQQYIKNYKKTLEKANIVVAPNQKQQINNNNGSNSGGQSNSNNEILTIAAMMMLQNKQNFGGNHTDRDHLNKQSQYQIENLENKLHEKDFGKQPQQQDNVYQDLVKRLQYYDEPILYSSDEETKKKSSQHQSQTLQSISQQQQSVQSQLDKQQQQQEKF